jgi:hypothetical protein
MNHKLIHKLIGLFVYLVTVVILFMTVQPSVSFWDCGELSAASYFLQVTHPPGAPLFILVNKFVSLIPFAENIGFRVNTLTVITSSFSVLFLYLVAVKLINNYKKGKEQTNLDYIITYIASAIGAFSLAFGDTFWFNSTESNVFGFSTFLFTLMVWLMMVWWEKADEPGNEKYLMLVAFIIGLSPGVHLMSVLAAVPFGVLFVMKKYTTDEKVAWESGKILFFNLLALIAVSFFMWGQQTTNTPPTSAEFKSFDSNFKLILLGVTIAFVILFRKKVIHRSSLYLPFAVGIGINFVIYPGIVKYLPLIISKITGNNLIADLFMFVIVFGLIGYMIYWSKVNKKPMFNLIFTCLFFAVLGITTYSMIIIRSNKMTPMNEDEPKNFERLASYLGREQYGDFPTWKRRYSNEPQHRQIWANYSSDLEYLLKWQIHHQYNRYLFWNYIGRNSWIQDDGVDFKKLFAIPFILGMLGIFYYFRRDWKMASVFLVVFIFMGYFICFYQDQQQAQPRERDYFYAGSFFIFSIFVALGVRGIIDEIQERFNASAVKISSFAVLTLAVLLVPVNMLRNNYFEHDRSNNWIPWDYAYNILQSCAPNAVLFTCGDNDTFPLWYLQDVEGVRRDVRIANLSLINTTWYPKQLKNETPYGTQKVAMSFSDEQLEKLLPMEWKPRMIDIPVPKNVYEEFGIKDTAVINTGKISFLMNSTIGDSKIKGIRNQDILIKDIIEQNKWQRPIYFAATCDAGTKIGLDEYLQLEGLTYRLTPAKFERGENVNPELTSKVFFGDNVKQNKEYQRGFIIRGFNDPKIFLDENQERTVNFSYRICFMSLASYYTTAMNNKEMTIKTLDRMEELFPVKKIPMDFRMHYQLAELYYNAGEFQKFNNTIAEVEKSTNEVLNTAKPGSYEIQAAQFILGRIKELRDSIKTK